MYVEEINSKKETALVADEDACSFFGVKKRKWITPKLTSLSVSETMGGNSEGQENYLNNNRS